MAEADGDLVHHRRGSGPAKVEGLKARHLGQKLAGLFLLVTIGLAAAAFLYLTHQQKLARAAAHRELAAIADLKLATIRNWREERLADARFFFRARFVADDLGTLLQQPGPGPAREGVEHWLNLLKGENRYHTALIFDRELKAIAGLPSPEPVRSEQMKGALQQALRDRTVLMTDVQQEPDGFTHLDVVFPILSDPAAQRGDPIAVIVLQLDVRQFLLPAVKLSPTRSKTAETLLVRAEGTNVLFLSLLQASNNVPFAIRRPLASPLLSAAKVLRGETNVIEGVDFRGARVVAAGRHIPGTPWALVAKVNREEIYAPLRQQMRRVVLVLGVAVLVCGLSVALLWRQRTAAFLQHELALERERAGLADRLSNLMRYANDAILLSDIRGQILEANERAVENYRYTAGELQTMMLRDLRAPRSWPSYDRDLDTVQSEGALLCEVLHQRKDGTAFPVQVSSRKIKAGGDTFILSIIRDITERKAYEERIERTVAERTAQLRETVGELESFSYSLSHDMRSPLRTMRNFCDLLILEKSDQLDPESRDYVQRISNATRRLTSLIDNVLSYTRVSRTELVLSPVDVEKLIDQLIADNPSLQPPCANVEVVRPLHLVVGHEGSLVQALGNLLNNAVKFVAQGALPQVRVWSEHLPQPIALTAEAPNTRSDASPGIVRLWVEDNGIGIPKQVQGRLFAMFQRMHSGYEGSGLGLSIVRKAVERMGGNVGVDSEVGRGSRFWIELKAARHASPEQNQRAG